MKNVWKLVAAVLAACVLAGVPAFFALREHRALGEMTARAESLRAEADSAEAERDGLTRELSDAREQLDSQGAALDAAKGELDSAASERDGLAAQLEEAQAKIRELSQTPHFDPDGPAYQQLYPDFYAPQPLDASQAPAQVIYLTFDDGPSVQTGKVLEILARENIKATFFIVGRSGAASPDTLRAMVKAGHTVGMHSWSHEYKTIYASVEAFLADMYKVFTLIRDETGVTPTYFRFPGGSTNSYDYGIYQDITAEMLRRGFVPCDWNMSAQDATKTPLPPEQIVANVLSAGNVARGVVLMHDSKPRATTVEALPDLIAALRQRGYTFAPLTPEVKPTLFNYKNFEQMP